MTYVPVLFKSTYDLPDTVGSSVGLDDAFLTPAATNIKAGDLVYDGDGRIGKFTSDYDDSGINIAQTLYVSGEYATISDVNAKYTKPASGIPESDLSQSVQTLLDAADTAYQKPAGGIPKSDLAGAVQTSLDKADSALQSAPVTSVAGKTGAVALAKSDVGLSNVDNVKQYSASNPPPYPVRSVNGKTGAVTVGFTDFSDSLVARQDNIGYYCTFQQGAVKGLRLGDQCIIQGRVKCIDFHWPNGSGFLGGAPRAAADATGRWWLDTMEDGGKVSMNRSGSTLYFARSGSSGVMYADEYISFFIMYTTMDAATLAATPAILFETAEGVVLDTAENRLAYPQQALLKDAQLKASAANTETVKADVD